MVLGSGSIRARLTRLASLLEAKGYHAVGRSRRFLAPQRRRTLGATRAAMLVVAVSAVVLAVVLSILHPRASGFVVALNGTLALVAIGIWLALGRGLRKRPELVAFAMGFVVLGSVMAVGLRDPDLVDLSVAYLMILPTVVALVIPWRTWTEVRWLLGYATAGVIFLALAPTDGLSPIDRADLVVGLVTSLLASFTGHVLLLSFHIRTFNQMQAISVLHRRENTQRQELERLYRTLEVTARTDELTSVGNRLKFDEDLDVVRTGMLRTGRPIGFLEIDLDHFKVVNDRLGHLAGDEVLRVVARAIRDALRADDSVYRYGGEEFVALLRETKGDVGLAGERVRGAVERLGIARAGNRPTDIVTVSVGAAAFGPLDLAADPGAWFARVDAALYTAKRSGRNRVVVSGDQAPAAVASSAGAATGTEAAKGARTAHGPRAGPGSPADPGA